MAERDPKPAWIGVVAGLAPALLLLGCPIEAVDLGSNHTSLPDAGEPDSGGGRGGPITTSDCPSVTEAEIEALYGHPCASTCADPPGIPRAIGSAKELFAVTSGRFRTCAGAVPWAADVVGIEFQAGCTIFLLHDAPDGGVVRGVTPDDQGTFDVVETTAAGSVTRSLRLYFPARTLETGVTVSDCPHRMRLGIEGEGEGDAGIDLVGIPSPSPPFN